MICYKLIQFKILDPKGKNFNKDTLEFYNKKKKNLVGILKLTQNISKAF